MASQPAAGGAQQHAHNNPLVVTGGSSELQVILHPLVLLSISDYIARHTLREQKGPVVGGLLGQQNGREITIEHAFDVQMTNGAVDPPRFHSRLEQMKTVHKDRQLDLVGWYTLLPSTGPDESILAAHRFFLSDYNESALLLGFHPDQVLTHSSGGKLPLTIYESYWEVEAGAAAAKSATDPGAEDRPMDDGDTGLQLRFSELAYSVETDETEMIGMNYVAAGGASAAATSAKEDKPSRSIETNSKGKRRLVESPARDKPEAAAAAAAATDNDEDVQLTRDEEEMVATLTAQANAIKMLQARIHLITKYLEQLPPSFVNGGKTEDESMDETDGSATPSLQILRQIQALVSRLDLVIPSDKEAFEREVLQESNDVHLVELLNQVMQSSDQARDAGRKFGIVESARARRGASEFAGLPTMTTMELSEIP
ncbi:COP9 signalosome complex subunit-like protein [Hapsidospora chrysogenum ATCC 11550]|uniref:COP9 signalosome complex subunit 6 n=1 Tax=Hapsidospora chrysogenum (strain ATCC 11550 / CBS 779.69 / DSM 880 / IAM 14645 / JCM 23072 / IMI 49137) TaxID=857340 RepID=A0A086TCT2_HAPC1|nr:COP9 signalosome complex subunit-like protein [Hapsidospora chrysogenum ATCC 11550]